MDAETSRYLGLLHREKRVPVVCSILICIGIIILPPFIPLFLKGLLTLTFIFAIYAMSLDIVMGYTGIISIMHASFFGIAAYTAAVLMVKIGVESFWIGLTSGVSLAGLLAAATGAVVLRVYGVYTLIVTLAMGYMIYSMIWGWRYLEMYQSKGIMGVHYPSLGIPGFKFDVTSYYYFSFLIFVICFVLLHRFVNSPFGYTLQGIREDEERMGVLGYYTWLYKYIAFIIGGIFAGIAGVLFAYYNTTVEPEHLGFGYSTYAILMVILGGIGTLFGPVIGAAIVVMLEFYTGIFSAQRWPLILGLIIVATIMFARGGIAVHLRRFWK